MDYLSTEDLLMPGSVPAALPDRRAEIVCLRYLIGWRCRPLD